MEGRVRLNIRSRTAVLLLLLACFGGESIADDKRPRCLYSFTVGADNRPVEACTEGDPLGLGRDARVAAAMRALGIPAEAVRFSGCRGQRFSASPDHASGSRPERYVVTYPTEAAGKHLAPIVHELAHVMQMRLAGGLDALWAGGMDSRQIELGADFLTGLVFSEALRHVDLDEFQHNLSLIGLYYERNDEAHGTPAQRLSAFRIGVTRAPPYPEFDFAKASRYFRANEYPRVIAR